MKFRNYVIIGQLPDETCVTFKVVVSNYEFRTQAGTVTSRATWEFIDKYPTAAIVRGGAGWSRPYTKKETKR